MRTPSETLVRKQFLISQDQVEKREQLSSRFKGRSAAQIVRDACDPDGDQTGPAKTITRERTQTKDTGPGDPARPGSVEKQNEG